MFDIQPNRQPDSTPREPVKTRSWWTTIPGQAAILVILGGVIVIALGFMGVVGPLSQR